MDFSRTVEFKETFTKRRIETKDRVVTEEERVRVFTLQDKVSVRMQEWCDKFLTRMGDLPEKKMLQCQDEHWFRKRFDEDRKQMLLEREEDDETSNLTVAEAFETDPALGQETLRNQLLLKQHDELPKLVAVEEIFEVYRTPPGYEVNKEAEEVGLYSISREEVHLREQHKDVRARAVLDVNGKKITMDETLDLLMSAWGEPCRDAFRALVVKPKEQEFIKYCKEHEADLRSTFSNLLKQETSVDLPALADQCANKNLLK